MNWPYARLVSSTNNGEFPAWNSEFQRGVPRWKKTWLFLVKMLSSGMVIPSLIFFFFFSFLYSHRLSIQSDNRLFELIGVLLLVDQREEQFFGSLDLERGTADDLIRSSGSDVSWWQKFLGFHSTDTMLLCWLFLSPSTFEVLIHDWSVQLAKSRSNLSSSRAVNVGFLFCQFGLLAER